MRPQIMFLRRGSTKFLPPVDHRLINGIVHVASTRLACPRLQHIWLEFVKEFPRKNTGGGGTKWLWRQKVRQEQSATQHSNTRHLTAMADTQLLGTPEGADWTFDTVSCEGCFDRTSGPYLPALLSATVRNHALWRLNNYNLFPTVKKRHGLFICNINTSFHIFSLGLGLLFFSNERRSVHLYI